jgi:hypothetical protein
MDCGMYRGKQMIDVLAKVKKAQAKIKARQGK